MRAPPQRGCNLLANAFEVVRTCEEQFLPYLEVAAADPTAAAAAGLRGGGDHDTALRKARSRMESAAPAYKEAEKALWAKEAVVAAAIRSAKEQISQIEERILLKKLYISHASVAKEWTYGRLVSSEAKALQERLRDLEVVLYVWGGFAAQGSDLVTVFLA